MKAMGTAAAVAIVIAVFCSMTACFAADAHMTALAAPHAESGAPAGDHAGAGGEHAGAAEDLPVLPPRGIRWPVVMMMVVLGIFLAAMVIGPIARMNVPEELPATHSHDEPPGTSPNHGHGGH